MNALPGKISSMIRRLPDLDGQPFVVDRAKGCHLIDTMGRSYIDYAMAMGATILGHAHPAVVDACTRALERGSMPGFSHELESIAADALVQDAGPLTRATFVTTGSEAVHLACRIARRTTGRKTVAKIAAGFNGWYDDVGWAWSGSPEADLSGERPVVNGVTLLRWNDLNDLNALFAERNDIAAILVEPMLANAGSLGTSESYLQTLADTARRHGAMVISDEVLMGFRLHAGPSCYKLGLEPDLVTLGKAIGSGVPVAAVIGTDEAFASVVDGRTSRAGTYHGNPLVTAAVKATMDTIRSQDYGAMLARGNGLRRAIEQAFAEVGVVASTSGYGSVFSLWLADTPPKTYAQAKTIVNPSFAAELHLELRRRGVVTIPGGGWGRHFVSFVHDQASLEETAEAYRGAAKSLVTSRILTAAE